MASLSEFTAAPTFSGATTQKAVDPGRNNTDVITPDIKLYIEGVQVPFESISISQSYQAKPTADIQVPPESGLLDITRGYEPKVHIFFNDVNYGGDRLLFWGIIKANSYSKNRSSGSTYITFHCEHKNTVLDQFTLDFVDWATDYNNSSNGFKAGAFNSVSMIIQAMAGFNTLSTAYNRLKPYNTNIANESVDVLDIDLAKIEARLVGMPGVAINLWNQIKKKAYLDPLATLASTRMYIPLFEEGISYFKRMSGHPFLENKLQGSKTAYCNMVDKKWVKVLVPPANRTSMMSAIQSETAVRNASNLVGFSGELTSLSQLIQNMYNSFEYDILTLASPAEIACDPATYVDDVNVVGVEKCAIETIIKPEISHYYAPTCNVLLPRMYSAININQNNGMVPTRVSAEHDATPAEGTSTIRTSFKGPPSFREAVAYNGLLLKTSNINNLDLRLTTGYSHHIPAKYEQGVGIRHEKIAMPWWLAILSADKSSQGQNSNQEVLPEQGTSDYYEMLSMSAEWKTRYAFNVSENDGAIITTYTGEKDGLNPYDPNNKAVLPHQRLLFSTIDYEYSKRVASSRTGNIDALFNPYVIPGYPIDIIDDSPNHPSFHAFCVAVTHTITSRSINTNIAISNAVTYAELSNYYIPPLSPYLQTALSLVNGNIDTDKAVDAAYGDTSIIKSTASTLIQNPVAKAAADTFYRQVLGVGAAGPDDLIQFSSNRAYPVERKAGILVPKVSQDGTTPNFFHQHQARETDDFYSSVGNLRLVRRPIESKESIQTKFGYKFIDLNPLMYNNSFSNYVNPILAKNLYLEPGASMFLDYMEVSDFIKVPLPTDPNAAATKIT